MRKRGGKIMVRKFWFLVLGLLMLVLVGCSGGGGGGNNTGGSSTPTTSAPTPNPIIQVQPNQQVTQPVGNIIVQVPAQTFPQGSEMRITTSQTFSKPPISDFELVGANSSINITDKYSPRIH
jgi:hypothetical protein